VIRNDQGVVVKVGAERRGFLMDALHFEMLACLMGVLVEIGPEGGADTTAP
jgi:hypothetical protein